MDDVVKGCKNHQHHHERQTDPEAHFLGTLRQRLTPHRLDRVEQKVTAVEQRNREQVQQTYRDRKDGRKVHQRDKTDGRDLSRNLRDPDRRDAVVLCVRVISG